MTQSTSLCISFKCFILQMLLALTLAQNAHYHGGRDFVYPGGISSRIDSRDNDRTNINKKYENLTDFARSIQIAKNLSNIESVNDILVAVGVAKTDATDIGLSSRIGGVERSKVEIPKNAVCMPELQVVTLFENMDPSKIYLPSCTRIKRCGGCCNHEALSCQPSQTEEHNLLVEVRNQSFHLIDKIIVGVEEHTQCMCNCRIKAEHCTDKHFYKEDECRCICKNTDEEEKCRLDIDLKRWDPDTCACLCLKVDQECSTGFFFDRNACSCKVIPGRLRFGNRKIGIYQSRQNENNGQFSPSVILLDAADPRRKPKEDPEPK